VRTVLFSISLLFSLSAKAQSPCGFIVDQSLYPVSKIVDSIEESPFMVACHEPQGLLKDRPATGLLNRAVPLPKEGSPQVRDFLETILDKAKARVEGTQNQINAINICLGKTAPKDQCNEIKEWVTKTLPSYLAQARNHLSLAQSEQELTTWMGRTSTTPNYDLSALGGYKEKKWVPLNKAERIAAGNDLKIAQEKFEKVFLKNKEKIEKAGLEEKDFVNQSMLVHRYEHYKNYTKMMAELPLLQYLRGPGVTESQLKMALAQMQGSLNKEKTYLEKNEKLLAKADPLDPELLGLMRYNSIVEEELIANNKNCGIATSLLYSLDNRQLGEGLAIGLPIMAISFFAPPILSTVAGMGAGAFIASQSLQQMERTKVKNLSHIYSEDEQELKELEMDNKQKEFDMVTLPLGLGLGNAVLSSLRVSRVASKAGQIK
jgi:hypothetical protein